VAYRDLGACFAAGHTVCSYVAGGPLHYRSLAGNDGGTQSQPDALPDAHPDPFSGAEADARVVAVRDDGELGRGLYVAPADAPAAHRHPLLCDPGPDGIVRVERSLT